MTRLRTAYGGQARVRQDFDGQAEKGEEEKQIPHAEFGMTGKD